MALPAKIQKTLVMKPEVSKIFDDLDQWLDHCRFNLLKYDPKDLYRSKEYREWMRSKDHGDKKPFKSNKHRYKPSK